MPLPTNPTACYIGVDPGQNGGIAWIYGDSSSFAYKMPSTDLDIYKMLTAIRRVSSPTLAVLEKVHSMPKQGVASSFKFGVNYGIVRMALTAAGIPFEEVTPQHWQKTMCIPHRNKTETPSQWKNRLKAKAQQLFPNVSLTLATADALLLAEYCRRANR